MILSIHGASHISFNIYENMGIMAGQPIPLTYPPSKKIRAEESTANFSGNFAGTPNGFS